MVGEILNQRTAPNRELLTTTNFWRPLQNSLVPQVLLYNATFSELIISYSFDKKLDFFEELFGWHFPSVPSPAHLLTPAR